MKSKFTKLLALVGIVAGLIASTSVAHAVSNFDLLSSNATLVDGNTTSSFFQVKGDGTIEFGASLGYTAEVGGNADTGFFVKIDFNGVQPELTSAFLKASNNYLWWDATDLAVFNAGDFDSITLWNSGADGIKNRNGKFQGTSHAGLNGTPGTSVPDGGTTAVLLGLALVSMGIFGRRRA